MNEAVKYSDEYISAYVDGELDSEERARLLFDEQTDKGLAQRINEARMLKEKVQLSYSDIYNRKDDKKTFSCSAFVSRHRALVASLLLLSVIASILIYNAGSNDKLIMAKQLIKNTPPVAASAISNVIGDHDRIIINVSQYQALTFNETINSIESLMREHDNDKLFNVEIVANGQGLRALDTDTSMHALHISQLANQFDNLQVVACAKSLAKLATDGDPIQLIASIMITPSAAEQVAMRTGEGWLYLKI